MKRHALKTWPEPFGLAWAGSKPFEIRPDDRGIEAGDQVLLYEWIPGESRPTGLALLVYVTHVERSGRWGLPPGLCVFGTKTISKLTGVKVGDLVAESSR